MEKILNDYEYRIVNIEDINIDELRFEKFLSEREISGFNCDLENTKTFSNDGNIRSVIVLFFPYMTNEKFSDTGNISSYARGIDYHVRIKNDLDFIVLQLENKYPKNNFSYQCDIGVYNERFYAGVSGLCIIGDNGSLINNLYGSYGNLALIYTDKLLKPFISDVRRCIGCNKCYEVCPSGAINGDGIINANKCLSYITQKKGELSSEEEALLKIGKSVFGCDICQTVCPHNKDIIYASIEETLVSNLDMESISKLTNKEFKEKYKNRAFTWRGKNSIVRNLKIISNLDNIQL